MVPYMMPQLFLNRPIFAALYQIALHRIVSECDAVWRAGNFPYTAVCLFDSPTGNGVTKHMNRSLILASIGAAVGAVGATLMPALFGAPAPGASHAAGKAVSAHKLVVGTPAPIKAPAGREIATLAGGCFWAMQTKYESLKGVDRVVAGYAGGSLANPSYEQVVSETTGHAETVQIVFDPRVLSYTDLLRIYFTDIDPTTLDRQGPDTGNSYRSAVFYHSAQQREAAEKVIREVTDRKVYHDPIVTEVVPYKNFYSAEAYHQDYYPSHTSEPYCAFVVAREVKRFHEMNQARLKS